MKKLLPFLALSSFLITASIAKADECSAFASDLINYANRTTETVFSPRSYKVVKVMMTTNRPDLRYVSYAQGYLKRFDVSWNAPNHAPVIFSSSLTGDAVQSFSDRSAYLQNPCPAGQICLGYSQPFNAKASDTLGISLAENGTITLTLKSWGNGTMTVKGNCSNNMIYGPSTDGTYFVFSFKKDTLSGEPS